MGTPIRYVPARNKRENSVSATLGYPYPYSKFRDVFHQPDMATYE
jgi:hypothetical protein